MENKLIKVLCKKNFYNFKIGKKYVGEEQKLHQTDKNPVYQIYQEETKEGELKGGISMIDTDFNQYFEICNEDTSKLEAQRIEIENKRIIDELWKPLKRKIVEHLKECEAELQITPDGKVLAKSNVNGFSFVNLELNLTFDEIEINTNKLEITDINKEIEKIKLKKSNHV